MTTIPSGHSVDWHRVPLPPGLLDRLNARSDALGLAQALGHLLLCVATGAYALWAANGGHWLHLTVALLLHGTVCAFMINAVHELVHGTVFRTRCLNTAFVHIFAFIGWINHRQFWASHAQHHLFTMHFPYDQENVFPIRYRLADFLRAATIDPRALPWMLRNHWRIGRGRLDGDWERHLLEGRPEHAAVAAWSRQLLLGHAAIAVASIASGLWIVPVVVSLTPLYGRGLFWLLNNAQHVGLQESAPDFRLNSRTIRVNPLFSFLYWRMNWHIEHHMYAAVPCYRLAALHRAISAELPPTPDGLVATWYEIIGIMWRQEREPGWSHRPALPGVAVVQPAAAATQPAQDANQTARRKVWQCAVCGFIYDEALGMPDDGIAAGTAWGDVPADWRCPHCGVAKSDFAMVEVTRPAAGRSSASARPEPVVIVGGGMAAYSLARELRRRDRQLPVTVLTRDTGEAYAKPVLSAWAAQGGGADGPPTRSAAELATELGIEIRTGCTVTGIDRAARRVRTSDGVLPYGRLVLALGGEPVRPQVGGDAAARILTVNDIAGYRDLRRALPPGGAVLIIGGGLVGCEFADDLRSGGYAVRLVDRGMEPLAGLVPSALGAELRRALQARGVAWNAQSRVMAVDACGGRLRATLADGSQHIVDAVLAATGLQPRTGLAREAGLTVGRGIRVGTDLATDDPAISALGDCAEIDGRLQPHVEPIGHAARALAATLTGQPARVAFPPMPLAVKTPSCPVIVLPPDRPGCTWTVEAGGGVARASDVHGSCRGFALTGAHAGRRDELLRELGRRMSEEQASAQPSLARAALPQGG